MFTRVVRLDDPDEINTLVAQRLLARLIELQATQPTVHLCLTGGNAANAMYEQLSDLAADSALNPAALRLWWGDERFVPSTDPERNSLQAVTRLARTIAIHSADTHMMPAKDGRQDSHEAAAEYGAELGDTHFDIILLGIGEDGHVGSIFPNHPSFEPTSRAVIGVTDSPKPPAERISLTIATMNRSAEAWFMATGGQKADAVAKAIAGDPTIPAGHVHGRSRTEWFNDEAAPAQLPALNHCSF